MHLVQFIYPKLWMHFLEFWAVTIDKGAKAKFSGASATPERKEVSTQGPTTTLFHQCEQQCDRQLLCFGPHRGQNSGLVQANVCKGII